MSQAKLAERKTVTDGYTEAAARLSSAPEP